MRIGILTAGGDTPALNATIFGAVTRANELGVEVLGILKGFSGILNPKIPHVHLNPLFCTIPELQPTIGGTILGASRTYIDPEDTQTLGGVAERLQQLKLDGLICIGGDGTVNGMQPLSQMFPCVLAPKTIDNDLGLNYRDEANEWLREPTDKPGKYKYRRLPTHPDLDLGEIVNYATPGYATAVYVAATGIQRVRTTAESHRRIAIIEVMGRDSGFIALGSAYGQPDMILLPEVPVDYEKVEQRVREIYELQKHCVLVMGEGVVDLEGNILGSKAKSADPAGTSVFSGAAEHLQMELSRRMGDEYFLSRRRNESAASAIFTRKLGHTQRGGRPILFDRFNAAQLGGKAVDLVVAGHDSTMSTLHWSHEKGFTVGSIAVNKLRDQWGIIHPRQVHPQLYDQNRFAVSRLGREYLLPIFTNAIGTDDMEEVRVQLFHPGNLTSRYQSVNIDIQKRIRVL